MQKWMYAVIAIVAVVAVMGVILGVRYLTPDRPPVENGVPVQNGQPINGDPDNGENGAPNGNGDDIPDVAAATSLQFRMELTNDDIGDFVWMVKGIGTAEFALRIDGLLAGFQIGYILNGELQRIWYREGGDWMEKDRADADWREFWDDFVAEVDVVVSQLEECGDHDCTYTNPDGEYLVRIYDISVNPDLDDALFEP